MVLLHSLGQICFCSGSAWSIEDSADIFGDLGLHLLVWHIRLGILLQVKLTALPGNAAEGGQPGSSQAGLIITGNELHPSKSTSFQALQEGSPRHFVFAQGHRNAQDLTFSVRIDAHSCAETPDVSKARTEALILAKGDVSWLRTIRNRNARPVRLTIGVCHSILS